MKAFTACSRVILAFLLGFSALAIDVAPAYALKEMLEPGDILFAASWWQGEGDEAQYDLGFLWEHVAIYIGNGKVVESIAERSGSTLPGTRVVSLRKFKKQWGVIEVRRLLDDPFSGSRRLRRSPVTREQIIQGAIAYALKKAELQTPYDWKGNKYDERALYCSELIWHAFYEVVSIDLDSNGGKGVPPDDLYWSKLLIPVIRYPPILSQSEDQDSSGDQPVAPALEN